MLTVLAVSLVLTLVLELAFALAWGQRGKYELTLVMLVNFLTNPAVVLLYHTATGLWLWPVLPVTLLLECSAILVEWLCYCGCSRSLRRPFLFALTANAFSYGMGCVVNLLF